MKSMIKVEELAMFVLSVYFFNFLDYPWWVFLALLLTPDISFLGYSISPKIGAYAYNVFHHKGIAIFIGILGLILENPVFQLAGIILFAHSSMDRMFGYGLKFETGFNDTHLGPIKKL